MKIATTLKQYLASTPVAFPLIFVFHCLALVLYATTCISSPWQGAYIHLVWVVAYTAMWAGVALRKKWAAIAYVLLTVADLLMVYAPGLMPDLTYKSPMHLIDFAFSVLIIIYFKKLA
ncbi:MAG: hypothetical protein EBZ77_05140 [Chitinophagia bacterium]|nr:hypothetical protein [Chitinophagia bacterium]